MSFRSLPRSNLWLVLAASLSAVAPPPLPAKIEPARPAAAAEQGAAAPTAAPSQPKPAFELLDGDRVVFLGDTLIEREQAYGYVEARLTARYPDRRILFRNLGWSADTPSGQSRVSFDWSKSTDEWFRQLTNQIAAVKPTVVFLGYGMAGSFAGEGGLPQFIADLDKLVDAIQSLSQGAKVRFIVLGAIRHENLGAPLPDPAMHNRQLELYNRGLRELAGKRGFPFISLYEILGDGTTSRPPRALTDDGIHLTAFGYSRMADAVEIGLGLPPNTWRAGFLPDGKIRQGTYGAQIEGVERNDDHVRFTALADRLLPLAFDDRGVRFPSSTPAVMMQFLGLKPGRYSLKVDDEVVFTYSDAEWRTGRVIDKGPQVRQAEQLRQAILKKNELFFHRWRPQNQTYLFGFRKYEQGQNAREIPQFDPLVEAQEKQIAELKRPLKHRYELVPAETSAAGQPANAAEKTKDASAPRSAGAKITAPQPDASVAKLNTVAPLPLPKFDVAPGFEISLFAENPGLAKPIQMNFDPQGRLWVASSSVYPQIQPGQKADDKILVLEDVDGDGKAEKSTVFADGLLIPTGVEPGDGGVYVAQSTELLFFKDTDGDGKADQRRVVLSGFGTEDTHHILHTLRWGYDGQLYMNQSIYIHSHIETPHGVVRLNSGGILSLRPPTMEVGVFMKGLVNGWGHHYDEFGQSFATDGAGGEGINYVVPGAMYVTYAGARRILGSVSPGSYPKFCSLEIIHSQHFPDDWQGNLITCDFRAHRVVRFAMSEKDSAYQTKEMPDVVRTTDVTFRPIDVKLGPDGALYIADWSNPIIQHGEVDFRDPRRDHEHGRIWRVTATGRPLAPKPNLLSASNSELLNHLLSPNGFIQEKARRVLTERGDKLIPDLKQWTAAQTSEKALLQALWIFESLNVVEPELLKRLLAAQDGRVRAAATRVLGFWQDRVEAPLDLLAQRAADEHPRVRLEAARALARIPGARSAELVLGTLEKPMDPFLDYAIWLSINDLAEPWVAAIKSGEWKPEGRDRQLEFGLRAIEPAMASTVLSQLLRNQPLPRDGNGAWIELIGRAGTAKELRQLFEQVMQNGFDDDAATRSLASLNQASRLRNARPSGALESIGKLFAHPSRKLRAEALRVAGTWKDLKEYFPELVRVAGAADGAPDLNEIAINSLREIGGPGAISGLGPLCGKETPPAIRQSAVVALAALDLKKAAPLAVAVMSDTSNNAEALTLWQSLLNIKGAAPALARALPASGFSTTAAKAGLRAAREGGRSEPELVLALTRSAGLEDIELTLTPAEIQSLVSSVVSQGDAARGERIYRRAELGCTICHAIGGAGGKVGPDLTSIGASAPVDYLIESGFYPNRKIKEGYHAIVIETKDDQELSGILVRENNEQVVIRDVTNKEVSVPKNNIKSRKMGGSLMPGGLIDALNHQEQVDLFRFLSELGKPGPYDASKGGVARFWRVRPGAHDIEQFGEDKLVTGDINKPEWWPTLSLVDGRLLSEDLGTGMREGRVSKWTGIVGIYAATRFQVSKAGMVRLKLSGATGAPIWVDGKPAKTGSEISENLTAGTHTLIVRLDPKKLPEYIRVDSPDGTFLVE